MNQPVDPLKKVTVSDSGSEVTRAQLHDLVWTEPMLRVAAKYSVSSSYLARVCTEMRVPRPPRGYWAQLEFGKSIQRTPLPPSEPGDIECWYRGAPIGTTRRTNRAASQTAGCQAETVSVGRKAKRISLHPMLNGAKAHFLKTRAKNDELLRPFKKLLVDIVVSEGSLDRALVSANTLFLALEAKGYRVTNPPPGSHVRRPEIDVRETPPKSQAAGSLWSPDRPTVVYFGEIAVPLTLFETTEEIEVMYDKGSYFPLRDMTPDQLRKRSAHSWTTHNRVPTGRFCLQASGPWHRVEWLRQWRETRTGQFESMIPRILRELEESLPELSEKIAEADRLATEERQRWDEAMARHDEESRLEKIERAIEKSLEDLNAAIESWNRARRVADYFDAVTAEIERLPERDRGPLMNRIKRARELLGNISPLESLKSWRTPDEIDD
jgi:hypothetical protein